MSAIDDFLRESGWASAKRVTLAGDASSRRYERLHIGDNRAILMIDPDDDTLRFASVLRYLQQIGLSAPNLIAHVPGLMLLEDLGDKQFAAVMSQTPELEVPLYEAAVDVLVCLHKSRPMEGLVCPSPAVLAEMISPARDYYLPAFGDVNRAAFRELQAALAAALSKLDTKRVTSLRDFHAENLIWLGNRRGAARVGLLDFQDAFPCHPAYDLVSMMQDARRDVSPGLPERMIARYVDATGSDASAFVDAYQLLGIQRNMRILGIFARLATHMRRPHYLGKIPRVWGHIETSLQHSSTRGFAPLVRELFPAPERETLKELEAMCLTA